MKVQFTHQKNIPWNNAIYELLESNINTNTEKYKSSDYRWDLYYESKIWSFQSFIDLKKVCGWVVTYL